MELVFLDLHGRQLLITHLSPGFVGVGIHLRPNPQAGRRLGAANQVDDDGLDLPIVWFGLICVASTVERVSFAFPHFGIRDFAVNDPKLVSAIACA